MATLTGSQTVRSAPRTGVPSASARRMGLAVVVLLAVAATTLLTYTTPMPAWVAADPDLARLLRAMALIKAVLAAAAIAAIAWRVGQPASPRLALGYAASAALLAAGPGLIWGLAQLAPGAALFHAGFASLLALAWAGGGSPLRRRSR